MSWAGAWGMAIAALAAAGGALLPPQALPAALAAALLAAAWVAARGWRPDAVETWLAAWLAWCAASAAWVAADPLQAKERIAAWTVALVVFATARRGRPSRPAAWAWAAAGALLAVGAVAEAAAMRLPRAGGLAENPNLAALLLVVAAWGAWPVVPRGARWGAAAAAAAGLLATGSRAGLAAAVLALAVTTSGRSRRLLPLALAAAGALVAWRLAVHPDPYAWRRPRLWAAAVRVGLERPLTGASPGGLEEAAYRHQLEEPTTLARWEKLPTTTESTFLVPLAESGVPGALLVLAALAAGAVALRRARPGRYRAAGLVIAGTFLAVHDLSPVPVALWAAAWVAGTAMPLPCSRSARPRGRAAVAVVLGSLLAWGLVRPAAARAVLWEARLEPGEAAAARRALELEPWSWPAVERLLDAARARGLEGALARVALARRLVRLHPGDPVAWRRLGTALLAGVERVGPFPGTLAAAREALGRATALAPHDPWGWLALAQLERAAGRAGRAAAAARRAVREEPAFARGWAFLARVELDRGRVEAARAAARRARSLAGRARGRVLSRYERALVTVPAWQLERLAEALR